MKPASNLPVKEPRDLPPKQRAFCHAYAVSRNATRAYMDVYGASSPEVAAVHAWRLLKKGKVREEIRRLEQNALARNAVTQDRIIAEYAAIAFSDVTQVTSASIYSLAQLPKTVRAAIKKVKHTESEDGSYTEVELHPKQAALDKLAEMAGLLKKGDTNVQVNTDGNTQVNFIFS